MTRPFNLAELLRDAEECPRLNDWEESFLVSMRGNLARFGDGVRISDKQMASLRKIEAKVYAAG